MEAQERWKTLQAHITAARAALEAGDRVKALDHADRALAIDPSFLVAQSLRERAQAPADEPIVTTTRPALDLAAASRQAHAQIQERARQRRIDHCVATARVALAKRQLQQAASAVDELIALDSGECNIPNLSAELADLRRREARRPFGARLAAAAAFLAVAGGASWLHDPALPRPSVVVTLLEARTIIPDPVRVAVNTVPDVVPALKETATIDRPEIAPEVERTTRVSSAPPVELAPPPFRGETSSPPPASLPVSEPPPPTTPPAQRFAPPAAAPVVLAAELPRRDDQELVQQTLERYRFAYAHLSAQSAQAVYPTVNRVALARAFDGLESQALTFDACNVELRGESATATCRGSMSYVPKIGTREARTEPRVWSFTLRKNEGDWTIENARAAR